MKLSLPRQIARFALIGGSNVVIDFGVYNLLLAIAPSRDPDTLVVYNTLAVISAIVNSYYWNKAWTFRHQRLDAGRGVWRERVLFAVQGVINVVVNDLVLAGITVVLNRNHLLSAYAANNLAKVVGVLAASSVSFSAMRWVVFRGGRAKDRSTRASAAQPSAAQPSAAQPSAAQPSAAQPSAEQPKA